VNKLGILIFICLLIPFPSITLAGSIVEPGGESDAVGKGGGGTSLLAGSNIASNPAKMLSYDQGYHFQLNYEFIQTDFSYNDWKSRESFHIPSGSLFYATDNQDKLKYAFGLWFGAPFGLGTNWEEVEMKSFIGLTRVSLGGSVGSESFHFGAAFNLDYGEVNMEAPLIVQNMALGKTLTDMDGFGCSYTLGFIYNCIWAKLGVAYTSAPRVKLKGETELVSPILGDDREEVATTISFPSKLNLAIALGPKKFQLVFDANYYNFNMKNVEFQYNTWPDENNRLDFKDIWSFHYGLEWTFWEQYDKGNSAKLRLGSAYLPAVTPEITRSPLLFDVAGYSYSAGLGYSINNWYIDLAYVYVDTKTEVFDDTYEAGLHMLSVKISL